MQHASYKALCASPAVQADFLEKITALLESIPNKGDNWLRREALTRIEVGGQAFSISKYLATLEMSSQDWDIDEDDVQLHRFVGAAKTMAAVHPELNVPSFTFCFHAMPGANTPPPGPKHHLENGGVFGHIIGAPGLAASVLSGAARTTVIQVEDERPRRAMRLR